MAGPGASPLEPRREISLAEKVAFLETPGVYPEPTDRVESISTHLSWIFLTRTYAYKLKKPVRTRFVDFTTTARRLKNCENEVHLNRRLAPDVYLDVTPLVCRPGGRLALGGNGAPVDHLVHMRRLPRSSLLDDAIEHGRVDDADLRRVALHLHRFYERAERADLSPSAYVRRLEGEVRENARDLRATRHPLAPERVEAVIAAQFRLLARRPDLFAERALQRRIVEGHGDLRPEHVHLGSPPAIIDCLEFSRRLRLLDPLDELGFLALECERLGAPRAGAVLLGEHARLARDRPPAPLLAFYQSHRAVIRAKLALWHLEDPELPHSDSWLEKARTYLALAERSVARFDATPA